jgi:hypothetical protein
MKARLLQAVQDAVVVTVKWLVVVALTMGLGYGLVADYLRVRQGAQAGTEAVQFINQQIAAAQKAQAPQK